jgi:hypothetical protein
MAVPPENAESEKHSRAAEEHSVNAAQKAAAKQAEQELAALREEQERVLPKPVGFLVKALESQIAWNKAHPEVKRADGSPLDPAIVPYFASDGEVKPNKNGRLAGTGKGFSERVKAGLGITTQEYRALVAYSLQNGHVIDCWAEPGRALSLPGYVKNEPAKKIAVQKDPETAGSLTPPA